jgi:hypothetical protein
VQQLAGWYEREAKDHWAAARVYNLLAFHMRGLAMDSKLLCMRQCLAALEHVPSVQAGAVDMKGHTMARLMKFTPSPKEKGDLLDRMVAWSKDTNNSTPMTVNNYVGITLCGAFPSKYILTLLDRTQMADGASLMMIAVAQCVLKMNEAEEGYLEKKSFSNVDSRKSTLFPYTVLTVASLSEQWTRASAASLGNAGELVLKMTELYIDSVESYHGRFMATSRTDWIHSYASFPLLSAKFANIAIAQAEQIKWETATTKVTAMKMEHPYALVNCPCLDLVVGGIERVFKIWGVDWHNAKTWIENAPTNSYAWTRDNGGIVACKWEAATEVVRGIFATACFA